jgi:hypothetical protein
LRNYAYIHAWARTCVCIGAARDSIGFAFRCALEGPTRYPSPALLLVSLPSFASLILKVGIGKLVCCSLVHVEKSVFAGKDCLRPGEREQQQQQCSSLSGEPESFDERRLTLRAELAANVRNRYVAALYTPLSSLASPNRTDRNYPPFTKAPERGSLSRERR